MRADDVPLVEWAAELARVDGVEAVTLGGSRARGTLGPSSDVDLGLSYRAPLDTDHLRALAARWCGTPIDVTEPGGWGPWVDGGGWLVVDGIPVDWIYRDLVRVDVSPPALRAAITAWLWEADFDVEIATKAVQRIDTTYVAGCLFRTVLACAHVLCAAAGCWVLNEKGAVAQAAALPASPPGFGDRAHALLAALGTTAASLEHALSDARTLVHETRAAAAR